ncbi:MAG: hypothetical protein EBU08_11500, partial [Micrococcales bacterium]|nr:hypothetical protein [Micrococcales bacterium]
FTANSSLYANSATYVGGQPVSSLNVNSAVYSTNATFAYTANNSLYANNANYLAGQPVSTFATTTGTIQNANNLNNQPASYYTNATNITTGTLPYAQLGVNVVNTTADFTISGAHTYNANIVIGSTGAIVFNTGTKIYDATGSQGITGQVLTSNGATGAPYWSTVAATNLSNTVSVSSNYSVLSTDDFIIANGTINIQLSSASTNTGRKYNIQNGGTGQVTVLPNGTDTINGRENVVLMFKNSLIGVMPSNSSNWLIF